MRPVLLLLSLLCVLCGADPLDPLDTRFDNVWRLDIFASGASWHPGHQRAYHKNQFNPGLGFGLNVQRREVGDISLAAQGVAMVYRDSFGELANFIGAGPQLVLGRRSGWHGELTALIGRLEGSGCNGGLGLIPYVGVGYKQFTLQGFYVPRGTPDDNGDQPGHPGYPISAAIGVWLKWSVPLN
jgi:hypothetical protein